MPEEKTINEISENKSILADNQEKSPEFEAEQAKLFREYWGIDIEDSDSSAISEEDHKEVSENKGEKVEEKPEEPKGAEEETSTDLLEKATSEDEQPEEIQADKTDIQGENLSEKYNRSLVKIQQLEKTVSELTTKIQSYQNISNTAKAIGLDDVDQSKVETVMKSVKQVADDLQNLPGLAKVIDKYYKGELEEDISERKIPQDFMPEGEVYFESDAYQDRTSESAKAYAKYKDWEYEFYERKRDFLDRVNKQRSEKSSIVDGMQNAVKKLVEGFNSTKVDLSNEFPLNEDIWSKFIEFYRSGDSDIIKAAFAVFAGKSGIKSKTNSKIQKNKDTSGFVLNSKTKKVETSDIADFGVSTDEEKEQYEYGKELGWWN